MKIAKKVLLFISLFVWLSALGQTAGLDTNYVNDLLKKSKAEFNNDPVKAIRLANEALEISKKIKFQKGEAYALKNIGIVHYLQGNYVETLDYWNASLKIFEQQNDNIGIANVLNNIASVYLDEGDDGKALEYGLKSLQIAEKTGDKLRIMSSLTTVGSIYHNKNNPKALPYFIKALPLAKELGNSDAYALIAGNIGETYFDQNDDKKALLFYQEAINTGSSSANIAFAYNGVGKIYLRKGNDDLALKNHYKALTISKKLDEKLHRIRALRGIANVYVKQGNYPMALKVYQEAKAIGEAVRANVELKDLYQEMADVYSKTSDYFNAFLHKSLYANIKDTLYNIETTKKLGKLQFDFDLYKKEGQINLLTKDKKLTEAEVQRQRFARNTLAIGAILLLIIAFVIYRNYRIKAKTNIILDKQKVQIENLLLNILPQEVANELQTTGHATPKHYDTVAVLFTDFKGFTAIAEKMTPGELVEELNTCFIAFDNIIDKYGLEKIKTIGDSYMCAGGLSPSENDCVYNMVKAGLEIQKYIEEYNDRCQSLGRECWAIRVGMHVGPVVAGVVGKKKYAYDIWGNTVNIASRMESNGASGKVNVSNTVFELIKDRFACSHRGKIYAKNVGDIDMYFIEHELIDYKLIDTSNIDHYPMEASSGTSLTA